MKKKYKKFLRYAKKHLSHFQFSVFRGDVTPSKLIQLENELKKVINKDFVCIIVFLVKISWQTG